MTLLLLKIKFGNVRFFSYLTYLIEKHNMADFSKQWCEINDPEMPWDFDILEEAHKLRPDHYISIICEGFGFLGIGKKSDGKIQLYFGPDGWIDYDKIVK